MHIDLSHYFCTFLLFITIHLLLYSISRSIQNCLFEWIVCFYLVVFTFAFCCALNGYIGSDLSVDNTLMNSNINTPLFYQISATWSNHEGSILLWCWILSASGFVFCYLRNPCFYLWKARNSYTEIDHFAPLLPSQIRSVNIIKTPVAKQYQSGFRDVNWWHKQMGLLATVIRKWLKLKSSQTTLLLLLLERSKMAKQGQSKSHECGSLSHEESGIAALSFYQEGEARAAMPLSFEKSTRECAHSLCEARLPRRERHSRSLVPPFRSIKRAERGSHEGSGIAALSFHRLVLSRVSSRLTASRFSGSCLAASLFETLDGTKERLCRSRFALVETRCEARAYSDSWHPGIIATSHVDEGGALLRLLLTTKAIRWYNVKKQVIPFIILVLILLWFTAFLLLTSNPFLKIPFLSINSIAELNPVLQDPILAIHPPCIYAGYVASAISLSLCVSFLLQPVDISSAFSQFAVNKGSHEPRNRSLRECFKRERHSRSLHGRASPIRGSCFALTSQSECMHSRMDFSKESGIAALVSQRERATKVGEARAASAARPLALQSECVHSRVERESGIAALASPSTRFLMERESGIAALASPSVLASLAWLDPVEEKQLYFWVLICWCFLTVGILLGSWWAYHELGWGGWWFWDPVENASLMPWLFTTACIHSIKSPKLMPWTVFACLATFLLSILGTFFVRSGLLASVHSFATDSTRGLFLLSFFACIFVLSIVASRKSKWKPQNSAFITRIEQLLMLQSSMLSLICCIVLCGTIAPILFQWILNREVSTGAFFFNATIVPLLSSLVCAMIYIHYGVLESVYYFKQNPKLSKQYNVLLYVRYVFATICIWTHKLKRNVIASRLRFSIKNDERAIVLTRFRNVIGSHLGIISYLLHQWIFPCTWLLILFHLLVFHYAGQLSYLESTYAAMCFVFCCIVIISKICMWTNLTKTHMRCHNVPDAILLEYQFNASRLVSLNDIIKWRNKSRTRAAVPLLFQKSTGEYDHIVSEANNSEVVRSEFQTGQSESGIAALSFHQEGEARAAMPLSRSIKSLVETRCEARAAMPLSLCPLALKEGVCGSISVLSSLNTVSSHFDTHTTSVSNDHSYPIIENLGPQFNKHNNGIHISGIFSRRRNMTLPHTGVILFILGVVMSNRYKFQFTSIMHFGQQIQLDDRICALRSVDQNYGPTYHSICGNLAMYENTNSLWEHFTTLSNRSFGLDSILCPCQKTATVNNMSQLCMFPEKRFFPSNFNLSTTKVAIHTNLLTDLYGSIGTGSDETGWYTTIMQLPFICGIWAGFILAACGGLCSLQGLITTLKLKWQ